jgi:hypothetical protein
MMRYRRPATVAELRRHLDKPCGLATIGESEPVPAILLDVRGSLARGTACVRLAGGRAVCRPLCSVFLGGVVVPSPDPLEPRARILHALLRNFLADYLDLVDPDTAAHLLAESAVFCEPDVPGWNDEDRAAAGVIAHVPTRRGARVTVFVQVEPEPSPRFRSLCRRVFDLELRHCQPVLASTVHLRGGKFGVNLETAPVRSFCGVETQRLYFTSFGLCEARAEHYLARPEPLAWALAAAMRSTRLPPDDLRAACLGRIASASLSPDQKRLLGSFVEADKRWR